VTDPVEVKVDVIAPAFTIRCAFCFRGRKDVPKLIMGSFCGICSDCIAECVKVLGELMAEKP